MRHALLIAASLAVMAGAAHAGACQYRPSTFLSGAGAAISDGGRAALSGAGRSMGEAGVYTLTHAVTGSSLLSSTAAGSAAAGAVSIIGGSGVLSTVGAIIAAPATVTAAAAAAVGIGALEGACYFLVDERITDYDRVDAIMADMAQYADEDYFVYSPGRPGAKAGYIRIRDADDQAWGRYDIRDLYIVNGMLKYRKWGPNRTVGLVGFVTAPDDAGPGAAMPAEPPVE